MIENPWVLSDYDPGPDIPDPECPVCGNESPHYIYLQDGVVIGCDDCVECLDASDFAADKYYQEREAEREHQEELNRHDD